MNKEQLKAKKISKKRKDRVLRVKKNVENKRRIDNELDKIRKAYSSKK